MLVSGRIGCYKQLLQLRMVGIDSMYLVLIELRCFCYIVVGRLGICCLGSLDYCLTVGLLGKCHIN